ncbi:MAG TPA: GTPase domain-containing protein [Spirillospora sp.]|nr:GTPase domain-containing protein [Spirillospora sp.]
MSNILDTLITVIVGTVTTVTRTISDGISLVQDFFYIKISGLSFIVLGARQTGKTTLIEWLRGNIDSLEDFMPEPTAAGGEAVPDFNALVDDTYMKVKPNRDVGGEYAMWETDWTELFRTAKPMGILFMMDHTDAHLQKDALNFVMQMIEDEPDAARHLKAFYIMVNKSDLWGSETTLDEIMQNYRNEQRRLRALAGRLGFKWAIHEGSLMTGKGVRHMLKQFFNILRPRSKQM